MHILSDGLLDNPISFANSSAISPMSEYPLVCKTEDNTKFPCIGLLKYRGQEFPIYNDDYGMSNFIVINKLPITVDSFGGETD